MIEQTERERDIEEQVASDVTGDGKLTDAPQGFYNPFYANTFL